MNHFCFSNFRNSDKIAVFEKDRNISFSEFDLKVTALCSKLLSACIRPQYKVGILMGNSIEFIIAIAACVKLNVVCVILPPQPESSRLDSILKEINPGCILVNDDKEINGFLTIDVRTLLEHGADDTENCSFENCDDDIAYIIYTSGSTGKPKGVVIPYKALNNYVDVTLERLQFDSNSRVMITSPFTFDASLGYIYCMLKAMASIVISHNKFLLPRVICSSIEKYGITHYACTPSLLSELIKYIMNNGIALEKMRVFSFGAEQIYKKELNTITEMKRLRPGLRFINRYGPTETTVAVSSYEVDRKDCKEIPIGKEYDNIDFYLLDDNMQQVNNGEIGELYIGGIQLMKEYYNDAALTESAIIQYNGQPVYRTYDMFIEKTDGLVYVGRNDDMLKRDGKRIYLSEIANIISEFDGVDDHICVKKQISEKEYIISAYVVVNDNDKFTHSKELAEKHYPAYMLPNNYVLVKEIPKSINGKRSKNIKVI